jgi:guanylate kinase
LEHKSEAADQLRQEQLEKKINMAKKESEKLEQVLSRIEASGKDKEEKLLQKLIHADAKVKEANENILKKVKFQNEKIKEVYEQHKQRIASEALGMWVNIQEKLKLAEEKREKNIKLIKKIACDVGQKRVSKDCAPGPEDME